MKIKVSILIPVYNTEKFLRKCLDSVINQTLKEIEIIITNDGSKDYSEKIIKEYINRDSRIKYTKQKNLGLGATRNKGISLATGEYIAFLDSDDWVDKDYYEIMYENAKKNKSDLVVSSHNVVRGEKKININKKNNSKEKYLIDLLNGNQPGFSWNKLYKTDLIKRNNLKFPERGYFENVEDQYFSIRSVYYANKVSFENTVNINYRINNNSIVNNYQKGLLDDIEKLYIENKILFNNCEFYISNIRINLSHGIVAIINNEFKQGNKKNKREIISTFRSIKYKNIWRDSKKEQLGLKDTIYMNLIRRNMFSILYYIAKIRCWYIRVRS